MFKKLIASITLFFRVFVVIMPICTCNQTEKQNTENVKNEVIVIKVPENSVYPIYIEEDIQKDNTKEIYPLMCISVMFLSYFRKILISPAKTKVGVHPFTKYLTETYVSDNGEQFTDGAYGSLYLHDEFMTEYLEKHGLETKVEQGIYSESEITWMVKNSLTQELPIAIIDSNGECYFIIGLLEYVDHDEFIAFNPNLKGETTIMGKQFQNEQISILTVQNGDKKNQSFFDEIFDVIKNRLTKMTESLKWNIQIWFYRELNSFLSQMKNMFSFASFKND